MLEVKNLSVSYGAIEAVKDISFTVARDDAETAKAIRDARLPEDDHSDTCSMCGKFCAVRSMNKALAGEYIDIL